MEENNDTKIKKENSEAPMFFNVMPKKNLASVMIAPSVKVEETGAGVNGGDATSENTEADSSFFKKYRNTILIIISLLILSGGTYFGYTKYIQSQYKSNDILVKTPIKEKTETKDSSSINPAIEGVSTPTEWQVSYFKKEKCEDITLCGDVSDPDLDGLQNLEEYKATTDPNNEDSDLDGLSDGDETKVFGTDPMNKNTANDPKYDDASFIKDGYDVKTGNVYTDERLKEIKDFVSEYSLHAKTITTLGDIAKTLYGLGTPKAEPSKNTAPTTTPATNNNSALEGFDQDPEAKLSRDMQRQATIRNIGVGLVRYHQDQKEYPKTKNFTEMYQKIKLYVKVAVNISDPVNKDPYVYGYSLNSTGDEFTLTYFSESLNTQIKRKTSDAEKDRTTDDAAIYDNQRMLDLNSLQMALKLYSNSKIAGNQDFVFPSKDVYKTELVPDYITSIPKDPKTKEEYSYEVSDTFDSFTLKATFDQPKTGKTGYLCNQEECKEY